MTEQVDYDKHVLISETTILLQWEQTIYMNDDDNDDNDENDDGDYNDIL